MMKRQPSYICAHDAVLWIDATDRNANKFFRPAAKNSEEPLENVSCDAPSINHVTAAFSPSLQESPDFVDLHHFEISERRAHDKDSIEQVLAKRFLLGCVTRPLTRTCQMHLLKRPKALTRWFLMLST